jgi:hypothetical protein
LMIATAQRITAEAIRVAPTPTALPRAAGSDWDRVCAPGGASEGRIMVVLGLGARRS